MAQSYGAGSVTFDYLYNLVNQRTDTTVDDNAYLWFPDQAASNSYLSNALNQYDDVDGTLFTYDGNGNLTGDGVNSYLYDVESRLVSAITPKTKNRSRPPPPKHCPYPFGGSEEAQAGPKREIGRLGE